MGDSRIPLHDVYYTSGSVPSFPLPRPPEGPWISAPASNAQLSPSSSVRPSAISTEALPLTADRPCKPLSASGKIEKTCLIPKPMCAVSGKGTDFGGSLLEVCFDRLGYSHRSQPCPGWCHPGSMGSAESW